MGQKSLFLKTIGYCSYCSFYCFSKILEGKGLLGGGGGGNGKIRTANESYVRKVKIITVITHFCKFTLT